MALTTPTNDLTGNTIADTYDQLLILDSTAGIVENTLKVVSTQVGKSALQLDDEKILIKGVDTSNAVAFEVQEGADATSYIAIGTGATTKGVTINESGQADIDFRVEGSSAPYALIVDGTNGNVGIGIADPDSALEILNTSTQLKLSYDATDFCTFTVDTNHDITITPSSTGQIKLKPTTDSVDFFQVLDADAGTPILNVDSTNERVGIGTASPDFNFEVERSGDGTAAVFGDGTRGIILGVTASAGSSVGTRTGQDLNFSIGGNVKMMIDGSDHYVGIGTISPGAKLTIDSGDILLDNTQSLIWKQAGGNPYTYIKGDGEDIDFYTSNGVKMSLLASGYVGIGHATPLALLQVGATATLVSDSDSTATSAAGLNVNMNAAGAYALGIRNQNASGDGLMVQAGDASDDWAFRVEDYDGATVLLAVRGDGNVGIGVKDPDAKLEVSSTGQTIIKIVSDSGGAGTSNCGIQFFEAGINTWYMMVDGNNDNRMTVADTNGDGMYMLVDGNPSAWVDSASGDLRMKDDISTISDALTKVNQIRGINFKLKKYKEGAPNINPENYKTDEEWEVRRKAKDVNRIGLISQEVYEVLPEAVDTTDDEKWNIAYQTLTPLLVEAIKELSAKVEALENA